MVFPPCGDEQSSYVDLLSGEGSTPLPRRGSAAVYLEDLASGVEQSNLIDMLSGKALRRLPRRGSAAVYLGDLASGVEQSNLIDVLSGEGSAPTPAKGAPPPSIQKIWREEGRRRASRCPTRRCPTLIPFDRRTARCSASSPLDLRFESQALDHDSGYGGL